MIPSALHLTLHVKDLTGINTSGSWEVKSAALQAGDLDISVSGSGKVTIQALGWRAGGRYLPLEDDIASVAYWYQAEPHAAFPKLPAKDDLEVK